MHPELDQVRCGSGATLSERLVERERCHWRAEHLGELVSREPDRDTELDHGRRASELISEVRLGSRHRPADAPDVRREPDRPARALDAAHDGLPDPHGRVCGELEAFPRVELRDRMDEAEVPVLDEVGQRTSRSSVPPSDRDDEAEVALHEGLQRVRAAKDRPVKRASLDDCDVGVTTSEIPLRSGPSAITSQRSTSSSLVSNAYQLISCR